MVVAILPILAGALLVQFTEPFPGDWLSYTNPHFWANMLRAITFFLGGAILGLIAYTMVKSIWAEGTVTGGHPRKKLYNHVTLVASGHGLLIVTLLFYVRERINLPLSPATPLALVGLVLTIIALRLMISYQNSRLRSNNAAKQILGTITRMPGHGRDICVTAVGSMEAMRLDDWVNEFDDGVLVKLTVEKIEEVGVASSSGRFPRRRGGSDDS